MRRGAFSRDWRTGTTPSPKGLWCDAVKRSSDPTGTIDIRRRYSGIAKQRFQKVRTMLQQAIVEHDVMGLRPASTSPLALAASTGNRELGFQTWLDHLLKTVVVEDGGWLRPMLTASYGRAIKRAMRLTQSTAMPTDQVETINALATLCLTELQGIVEAVSQRIMRAVLHGWLHNDQPKDVFTQVASALSAVGVARSSAMIELMVVKTFSTATLDQFAAAGIKRVGLVAESRPRVRKDARTIDAAKSGGGTNNFKGAGSRIGREEAPSRSTIFRIKAAQRSLEEVGQVNVQTAGDDDVCQQCEDIEGDNPYSIDSARSLIPAHPRCRCAFVPLDDAKESDFGGDYE